ncbi:hypothetical protein TNCV_4577251 [Trichonephila clavipes]|nr:hypothetical protein TNCV_4577251 [Trichonephila clavipes]
MRLNKYRFVLRTCAKHSGVIWKVLSLWNWKKKEMLPFSTYSFTERESFQHFASFHTKDSTHFISCSKKDVTFFKLDNDRIIKSVLSLDSLYDEKACKQAGDFTQTIFSPVSPLAITGTSKGKVILWGRPLYVKEKTTRMNMCLQMKKTFPRMKIAYLISLYNVLADTHFWEEKQCVNKRKKLSDSNPDETNSRTFVTNDGTCWENITCGSSQSIKSVLTIDPMQRICLRMMQAFTSHCAITYLGICENLIVVGTSESKVCFFNETFQLLWSIKVPGNSIAAVSFNFKPKFSFKQAVFKALGRKLKKESPFEKNDFIVCTDDGYAGYVKISSSEITDVLSGTAYTVKSVVVHPTK